jgi:hypothetical protein
LSLGLNGKRMIPKLRMRLISLMKCKFQNVCPENVSLIKGPLTGDRIQEFRTKVDMTVNIVQKKHFHLFEEKLKTLNLEELKYVAARLGMTEADFKSLEDIEDDLSIGDEETKESEFSKLLLDPGDLINVIVTPDDLMGGKKSS